MCCSERVFWQDFSKMSEQIDAMFEWRIQCPLSFLFIFLQSFHCRDKSLPNMSWRSLQSITLWLHEGSKWNSYRETLWSSPKTSIMTVDSGLCNLFGSNKIGVNVSLPRHDSKRLWRENVLKSCWRPWPWWCSWQLQLYLLIFLFDKMVKLARQTSSSEESGVTPLHFLASSTYRIWYISPVPLCGVLLCSVSTFHHKSNLYSNIFCIFSTWSSHTKKYTEEQVSYRYHIESSWICFIKKAFSSLNCSSSTIQYQNYSLRGNRTILGILTGPIVVKIVQKYNKFILVLEKDI